VEWKLQLIVLPVADVDRAKAFYVDRAGFHLDVDHSAGDDFRVVQLTPSGSACSIALMKNPESAGAVKGLQMVVADIDAARRELTGRKVSAGDLFHFVDGTQKAGPHPTRGDFETFFSFSDPDGNEWLVQEFGHPSA